MGGSAKDYLENYSKFSRLKHNKLITTLGMSTIELSICVGSYEGS